MTKLKALILMIALMGLTFMQQSFAALPTNAVYELNFAATAGNINGGGFNPGNSFSGTTDLACTSATGSTPTCTSATYTFVTTPYTDAGAWLFIKSGTNFNTSGAGTAGGGCFWPITSVSGGGAVLNAAIGAGVCITGGTDMAAPGIWLPNTAVGVATTASPTGGTFGVDYSRGTAAIVTATSDIGSLASDPVLSSAGTLFSISFVGNILHITGTGVGGFCTVGWYELISYTSTSVMTADRASNGGTGCVAGTGQIGGAMGLASTLDADFFAIIVPGNKIWAKYNASAFTFGEAPAMTVDCTSANTCNTEGYNTIRGDVPTGANRPTINAAALTTSFAGDFLSWSSVITNITTIGGFTSGNNSTLFNIFATNSSGSASRIAWSIGSPTRVINSEFVSALGIGLDTTTSGNNTIIGNNFHDSVSCAVEDGPQTIFAFNVFDNCSTAAITLAATRTGISFLFNTFYGAATPAGIGINGSSNTGITGMGNIFFGFTTGITFSAVTNTNRWDYNDYFNNTTNRTNVMAGTHDLAVDPTFTNGPGANFALGNTLLKGTAFPGAITGSSSTGAISFGAIQPSASGGSVGGSGFVF